MSQNIKNGLEYGQAVSQAINQAVVERYKLDDAEADCLYEHIKVMTDIVADTPRLHDALSSLFAARYVREMGTISYYLNHKKQPTALSIGQALDEIYQVTESMIADGSYSSWDQAVKSAVDQALTYNCYEPWDHIVTLASDFSEYSEFTQLAPYVINYLYDGYNLEEELA